jgi:ABC-type antimicrobial peptide transport system permease subunit
MFNLENEIRNWLRSLRKSKDLEDSDIAELESHLRDEIDYQIERGLNEEAAFRAALEKSAPVDILRQEYEKAKLYERSHSFWHPSRVMPSLIWSYIKIALRKIRRHKTYSFINVAGLAVGMSACILILLWVQSELSYDRFHEKADHLFRAVEHERMSDGRTLSYPLFPTGFGPAFKSDFPQVLETVRFRRFRGRIVRVGDKSLYEDNFAFADPELFKIFTFPLLQGNRDTVLSSPSSIVLTEGMAQKYFGEKDPIGQIIQVDGTHEFQVTGVLKTIPHNSQIQFDFVVPFIAMKQYGWNMNDWGAYGIRTYVLLNEHTDYQKFNTQIEGFLKKYDEGTIMTLSLQPFKRVHLHSAWISASGTEGDIKYVYIFSLIAFFILLMACVNFMNLTTARSENRAREVGVRKVVGAKRKNLIFQFFGESILLSLLAFIFAVSLAQLALPAFNSLTGKEMSFQIFTQPALFLGLLGIAALTGVIAGSYPALFLSSFQPIKTLRTRFPSGIGGGLFRRTLVVSQFVLTICLVIATVIVNRQMHYIRNMNLGIEKEHVLCLNLKGNLGDRYQVLKNEISRNPSVITVTAASDAPGGNHMSISLNDWEGRDTDAHYLLDLLSVDLDYLKVFGLDLVEGRFFRASETSKEGRPIVVNETAIKAMGMTDPIGKRIRRFRIIGVIRDYHFDSLHNAIAPLGIIFDPDDYDTLLVKIQPGNLPETLAAIKESWLEVAPEYPFEFRFLDEFIDSLYKNDQKVGRVINIATVLALFIACLGLFGMASFSAEQRTKEIGIRKVFGASIPSIFFLLSKQFSKWVIAANVVAWPVAYFLMSKWLSGFAFRTSLNILFFVFAAAAALMIAMITVSCQTLKAAFANPIHSLRHE